MWSTLGTCYLPHPPCARGILGDTMSGLYSAYFYYFCKSKWHMVILRVKQRQSQRIISDRCGTRCSLRGGSPDRLDRRGGFPRVAIVLVDLASPRIDLPVASRVHLTTDKPRAGINARNNRISPRCAAGAIDRTRKNQARSRLIEKVARICFYELQTLSLSLSLTACFFLHLYGRARSNISRSRGSDGEGVRSHDAVSAHRARHARHAESVQARNTSYVYRSDKSRLEPERAGYAVRIGKSNGNF